MKAVIIAVACVLAILALCVVDAGLMIGLVEGESDGGS